jgi:WD40 repeat protein
VATAGYDDTARVWGADGAPVADLDHPDWVSDVAFSPDGTSVVTGGYDGMARVWLLGARR